MVMSSSTGFLARLLAAFHSKRLPTLQRPAVYNGRLKRFVSPKLGMSYKKSTNANCIDNIGRTFKCRGCVVGCIATDDPCVEFHWRALDMMVLCHNLEHTMCYSKTTW